MSLTKSLSNFPGSQTFTAIYNSIPGSPTVKNVVAGVLAVGAVVLGAMAVAVGGPVVWAGLVALGGALTWFLGSGLLVQMGVLLGLAVLWMGVRTAAGFIYTFDWNISDKAIAEAAKGALDRLYQPIGEAVGKTLGWLTCGFAPGALVFCFSPATAVLIQKNLGAEMWREISPQISNIAGLAAQSQANVRMLQAYGSTRKWIKRPGTPFHDLFKKMLGKENFAKWGTQDDAPFIVTKEIDKQIEKVEDKNVKSFLEGAKEGFEEGCREAALSINTSISEQIAATRLANASQGGAIKLTI